MVGFILPAGARAAYARLPLSPCWSLRAMHFLAGNLGSNAGRSGAICDTSNRHVPDHLRTRPSSNVDPRPTRCTSAFLSCLLCRLSVCLFSRARCPRGTRPHDERHLCPYRLLLGATWSAKTGDGVPWRISLLMAGGAWWSPGDRCRCCSRAAAGEGSRSHGAAAMTMTWFSGSELSR